MPIVTDAGSYTASTTGNDVIEEALRLLLSDQREEMNKLSGNLDAGATTITFRYDLQGIRPGALINIDLETYRVWDVDTATKSATVEPAQAGTVSAGHADGALVYVNPRMSRAALFKAINDEISSYAAEGLFAMGSYEFTYSGAELEYDFPAVDLIDVYEVRMSIPGPEDRWMRVGYKYSPSSDSSSFSSGQSIFIPEGMPGRSVRVLYKRGFNKLVSPQDDLLTQAGLPVEMHDIPSLGALARIGMTREAKRNFTESQGDTRRASEVPPQAVGQSFKVIQNMRDSRIQTERERLMRKWAIFK